MPHGCTEPLRIDGAHHFLGQRRQRKSYFERPYPNNGDYNGLIHIMWLFDAGPLDGARGMCII